MNFAFPALFIFLLTLPGILLRHGYKKGVNGGWKNPFFIQSLGDEIAWSVGLASVLHFAWIPIWRHFQRPVDLKSALGLLVAGKDDMVKAAVEKTANGLGEVALYFFSLCGIAYLLGLAAHGFVRGQGLDHRCRLFRFDNPWFYLLSGESLTPVLPGRSKRWWKRKPHWWPLGSPKKADIVKISAAVKQGNDVYLYVGKLESFEFDRIGQLDRLVLKQASRRLLSKDREPQDGYRQDSKEDPRFYPIETYYFVIRYVDICTLNVEFIVLREILDEAGQEIAELKRPSRSAPRCQKLSRWWSALMSWGPLRH